MARLGTTGYESQEGITGANVDGYGLSATVSVETGIVRSGAASAKINSGAGNASGVVGTGAASVTGTASVVTWWVRAYCYFASLPGTTVVVVRMSSSAGGFSASYGVGVDSAGLLSLRGASGAANNGTLSVTTGQWYRIEVQMTGSTGGNVILDSARLDGVDIGASALVIGTGAAFNSGASAGWHSAPGANLIMYVDDMAWNDNSGANQNTWPGSGKVVLLKPLSLNANGGSWTDDAAASTSAALTNAIDNTPPKGIADTTAGGGDHQVRNAAANTNLDMNLATYSSAGITAADTINVLQPMVNVGAPASTGGKSGSFGITSNPTIAQRTFTGGSGTAAFFWRGTAAAAYPTGWGWELGTVTYAPAVTVGTSPVARLSITAGTTSRIAMSDAVWMYVDYTPASPHSLPHSSRTVRNSLLRR